MSKGYRRKIEPFLHISLSISFYIYVYSPLHMRVQITCLTIVYIVPEAQCGLEVNSFGTALDLKLQSKCPSAVCINAIYG